MQFFEKAYLSSPSPHKTLSQIALHNSADGTETDGTQKKIFII